DFGWRTADARGLPQEYLRRRGTGEDPVPYRQRMTQSWREQAERFLTNLDRWPGARETATLDYFYQKAVLFSEALIIMPPSDARTHGLRSFIDFLRHADMDRVRRGLWFVFANRLIEL